MKNAKINIKDIDLISYSAGPGLGPCLRIGSIMARSLSSYYKIPIYPVHHAIGHIDLGKLLTNAKNPLVLLISGGHTMILAFVMNKWRVFGETLDITLGQLLDQFGRHIGFASPCGKKIEELAKLTTNYIKLPYAVKGNDVSFSGLLSATKNSLSNNLSASCYSMQETAFSMIGEVVERALSFVNKKELLVVGGVSANKRLSQILSVICNRHNCKLLISPSMFSGDCGSQIAINGILQSSTNSYTLDDAFIKQSWRIDQVQINYYDHL